MLDPFKFSELNHFSKHVLDGVQFTDSIYIAWIKYACACLGAIFLISLLLRKKARRLYGEPSVVELHTRPLRALLELPNLLGWMVAFSLLFVAASEPYREHGGTAVMPEESVQLIAACDASLSFAAEDYRPSMPAKNGVAPQFVRGPYGSRLDYAKLLLVRDVMPHLTGNQVGLLAYCGEAITVIPPTTDQELIRWTMANWLTVSAAPQEGSNYADALLLASEQFQARKRKRIKQVLILFSDGGLDGDEEQLKKASEAILKLGVSVFIIGLGRELLPPGINPEEARVGAPIPLYSPEGARAGYLDDGQTLAALSEDNLKKLARRLRGTYLRIPPGRALSLPWEALVDRNNITVRGAQRRQLHWYPLAAALGLIALLLLCRGFRRSHGDILS